MSTESWGGMKYMYDGRHNDSVCTTRSALQPALLCYSAAAADRSTTMTAPLVAQELARQSTFSRLGSQPNSADTKQQ